MTPFKRIRYEYLCLTLLLCLPILLTKYPPLVDYPAHLARCYIITHYYQSAFFQQHYDLHWGPIPNLGMDLIVPLLIPMLGTIWAGKVFLLATLLLYSLACYLLAETVNGKESRASFIPLFFFYNATFCMGFVNYVAGITLFLFSFALWLRWRGRWSVTRWSSFCLLTFSCYLIHLSSVAILFLVICSVLLWESITVKPNLKELLIALSALVIPVLSYHKFMSNSGRVGVITMNTLTGKLIALIDVIRGYEMSLDFLLILVLFVASIHLFFIRKTLSVNLVTLVPALVLLIAFAVCPLVLYTSSGADARFVWPACVLLSLSICRKPWDHTSEMILKCVVVAFLIHTVAMWGDWYAADKEARHIVRYLDAQPSNSSIYPAFYLSGDIDSQKQHHGLEHVSSYAVIDRDDFVPRVFAQKGQQPLILKGKYAYHDWSVQGSSTVGYDYLWTYCPPRDLREWLWRHTLIDSYLNSSLWKLQKPSQHIVVE